MSLLSSPASRTSPRLVASQSMAYLFIEGNEAKFCLSRPRTTGYGLVKVTFPTVTSAPTSVMLGRESLVNSLRSAVA
jgi:hypothetical protein